jgi:hypothetical protein
MIKRNCIIPRGIQIYSIVCELGFFSVYTLMCFFVKMYFFQMLGKHLYFFDLKDMRYRGPEDHLMLLFFQSGFAFFTLESGLTTNLLSTTEI